MNVAAILTVLSMSLGDDQTHWNWLQNAAWERTVVRKQNNFQLVRNIERDLHCQSAAVESKQSNGSGRLGEVVLTELHNRTYES